MSKPLVLILDEKIKGDILYENETGIKGDVPLNLNPTNYKKLEVELKSDILGNNDIRLQTTTIIKPKKNVIYELPLIIGNGDGQLMRISVLGFSFTEATMKLERSNILQIYTKVIQAQEEENSIYVTRVIGYK